MLHQIQRLRGSEMNGKLGGMAHLSRETNP
jgi:hypothetical protein